MMLVVTGCGSSLLVAVGLRSLLDHAALALPTGVAAYASAATCLVVLPVSYSPARALILAVAVAAAAVMIGARHHAAGWAVLAAPLGWGALTVVLSVLAIVARSPRVSPDSFSYLLVGGRLADAGGLEGPSRGLVNRQMLTGAVHDLASLYSRPYLASLAPLFTVSGLLALVWLFRRAGRGEAAVRRDWLVLLTVLLAVFSGNRVMFNAFYLNSHMMVAVFVLLLAAGAWLVAVRQLSPGVLALASLWIVPTLVARPESPVLLVTILLPVVLSSSIARRWRGALAWTFAGATVLWWGFGLGRISGLGPTSPAGISLACAALVLGAFVLGRTPLVSRHGERMVGGLVQVALWLGVVIFTIARGWTVLVATVQPTVQNAVLGKGLWGATLVGVAVAVAISMWVEREHSARLLLVPVASFVPLGLLLGLHRGGGYRIGPGDSLNRMWMHVLLLAAGYLIVVLTARTEEADRSDRAAVSTWSTTEVDEPAGG